MIKLHMVGGRTVEVTDEFQSIKLNIKVSKKFIGLTELIPTHSKGEEHNTRSIWVNINNILYVSYE